MFSIDDSLKVLNRLSAIKQNRDVFGSCFAISEGAYCPAFGIAVSATLVEDAAVVIVGTPECAWYIKNIGLHHSLEPAYDRFYLCTLDQHDITFGEGDGISQAICEVAQDTGANCIVLASTCVPEVIGIDIDAIAVEAGQIADIRVLPVHIAHYDHNCYALGNGVSRTLEAFGTLMSPQPVNPLSVNLLGRYSSPANEGTPEDTELVSLLEKHGCTINLSLPGKYTTEEIIQAPRATLNIVTSEAGKDLAEFMEAQFDTPFVTFESFLDIDYIDKSYQQIQSILGIKMQEVLAVCRNKALKAMEEAVPVLEGKTFMNGSHVSYAIEMIGFLTKMGMEPLLVNAYRLTEQSNEAIEAVLSKGLDPYVNYSLNLEAVAELIAVLSPDIFIGVGDFEHLNHLGIPYVERLAPAGKLGYETIVHALCTITSALEGNREHEVS